MSKNEREFKTHWGQLKKRKRRPQAEIEAMCEKVFKLRLRGLTYEEISKELGEPTSTIEHNYPKYAAKKKVKFEIEGESILSEIIARQMSFINLFLQAEKYSAAERSNKNLLEMLQSVGLLEKAKDKLQIEGVPIFNFEEIKKKALSKKGKDG